MLSKKLPKGGSGFRISGTSGFSNKLSSLTRYGQFSSLKDNKNEAIAIFETLVPTIRRNGKIPLSTRRKALSQFSRVPGVSKQDVRNFKRILEFYT